MRKIWKALICITYYEVVDAEQQKEVELMIYDFVVCKQTKDFSMSWGEILVFFCMLNIEF